MLPALAVVAAYLALYTAFDKGTRSLVPALLLDVLLVRRGVAHSLVELNKVISLAGLTMLGLGAPWEAAALLWPHAAYSLYKYYGDDKRLPAVGDFPQALAAPRSIPGLRAISALCGAASLLLLTWWPFSLRLVGVLGLVHFVAMEVDYKMRLGVRPFGYASVAAVLWGLWSG